MMRSDILLYVADNSVSVDSHIHILLETQKHADVNLKFMLAENNISVMLS